MDDLLQESLENEEVQKLLQNVEDIGYYDQEQIYLFRNSVLEHYSQNKSELKQIHDKLNKYKYIDGLDELHLGRYIRWFKKEDDLIRLNNGGFIIDISLKNDINIVCKNNINRIFNLNFNECIIFQKITLQEELVMNVIKCLKESE
jgi:hypothetical protein